MCKPRKLLIFKIRVRRLFYNFVRIKQLLGHMLETEKYI